MPMVIQRQVPLSAFQKNQDHNNKNTQAAQNEACADNPNDWPNNDPNIAAASSSSIASG